MDLYDAIHARHTTNGAFDSRPVSQEDKQRLLEMAARAPSHFNSQPWRFILVENAARRKQIGHIAGESMRQLIENGEFWQQYRRYFRFNQHEVDTTHDGIHFDTMPNVLKPFVKYLFTDQGNKVVNAMQVPRVLGNDARKLVESSPLLLGLALNRTEYKPDQLSSLYSVISLGAVVQTIWLSATALGMGLQFVSTPQEIPTQWARVSQLLQIPDNFELLLMLRLGYVNPDIKRPTIDWTSPQRKGIHELAFQEQWGEPLTNEHDAALQ
ncbi:MAG: nitroreductase family protein [Herpetosiphonaceae bacterium]|nr:nitroreductase family protein [Herpetosiphonaceae bacterium]